MELIENSEIKRIAREKLKGNWLVAIPVYFTYWLITQFFTQHNREVDFFKRIISPMESYTFRFSDNFTLSANFLYILIGGAFSLGLASYFLNLIRDEKATYSNLFSGFKYFTNAFLAQLITSFLVILQLLLLIIPGIVALFRYSMVYYILKDNPEMAAGDAVRLSKNMMDGYKIDLFMLFLSFAGWWLLSIATLGLGFLFTMPYYNAALAVFYEDLKQCYSQNSSLS